MKKCPLEEKHLFNPEEAVQYYGLSRVKLRRLLECGEHLPFLLFYRKRKLIERSKFEAFLKINPELRELLKPRTCHKARSYRKPRTYLKKGEWRGRPKRDAHAQDVTWQYEP